MAILHIQTKVSPEDDKAFMGGRDYWSRFERYMKEEYRILVNTPDDIHRAVNFLFGDKSMVLPAKYYASRDGQVSLRPIEFGRCRSEYIEIETPEGGDVMEIGKWHHIITFLMPDGQSHVLIIDDLVSHVC